MNTALRNQKRNPVSSQKEKISTPVKAELTNKSKAPLPWWANPSISLGEHYLACGYLTIAEWQDIS